MVIGKMRTVKFFLPGCRSMSFLYLVIFASILFSCNRSYDNPFQSGNRAPAEEAWIQDGNHDGIADSVQKYFPNCSLAAKECLEKAQVNQLELAKQDSLKNITASLPIPKDSTSTTTNKNASSNNTSIISNDWTNSFIKQNIFTPPLVSPYPIPVTAVFGTDLSLFLWQPDITPIITFIPANATNQNYILTVVPRIGEPLFVISIVEGKIHLKGEGICGVRVTSMDGGFFNDFTVTVIRPPGV